MSELIENKLDNLFEFAHRLIDGENGKMLIETYQEVIETVNATEAMQVFDRLLTKGYPVEKVKANVGKIVNVFFKSLNALQWNKPGKGHFLFYLMRENREVSILTKRQAMAMQLQTGIEKRLSTGDANIFEANRVRSELSKTQSELQITESRRKALNLKLTELNGGKTLIVTDTVFSEINGFVFSDTSTNVIFSRNPQVKQWEAEIQIPQRNISLQRALSLPKFEIGYRQDINTGQTFSGFHAGISILLFENKNTVKSAKARQLYANEAFNAYRLELQSNVSQLMVEYKAVQLSVSSMNEVFKTLNTPELLLKAYKGGQINYTEFFSEYENYQQTALYLEELNQKAASLQLQLYILSVIN